MYCRRAKTRIVIGVAVCGVFFTVLYISGPTDSGSTFPRATTQVVMGRQPSGGSDYDVSPLESESWVDQGGYLPFNVSYSLLAGTPPTGKRFLTVGMSSVKRPRGGYLLATLRSVFSRSSPAERASMLVVVLLADFDARWREATVGEIRAGFAPQLEQGQLLVVHVPRQFYPPLTGLKRNFGDAADRVSFRSKQNVDYSFLLAYSQGRSQYYLMLEDDVDCSLHFLTAIRERVREQEAKAVAWTTLEFSSLGYIGKLYRSAHLPMLSRLLFLFYQEMPCDFLLSHFRVLLVSQKEPIQFKPALFQHMGTYSSFQGTHNRLKDQDFEQGPYSNPPASAVHSDIPVYQGHLPSHAYLPGTRFFWGRAPAVGNHLTVVLKAPAVVTAVRVETGSEEGRDRLGAAAVELGSDPDGATCRAFGPPLGEIGKDGRFEMQDVERKHGAASSCLRIRVTGAQKDWVIVRRIVIRELKGPKQT